jgi:hypothetical protein
MLGLSLFFAGFVGFVAGRWAYAAGTDQVALSVDRDGVTLGSQPFPVARTVTVPWNDVNTIELNFWDSPFPTIGLGLRPGAMRPPGVPTPGSLRALLHRAHNSWTGSTVDVSHLIRGWTLDRARLSKAIVAYGPDTQMVIVQRVRRRFLRRK